MRISVGDSGILAKDIPGGDCICHWGIRAGTWIRVTSQHSPKRVMIEIPSQQVDHATGMMYNNGTPGNGGAGHKIKASRIWFQ